MADVKFVPSPAGMRALLKSAQVAQALQSVGDTLAARCGDGFGTYLSTAGDRARVYVRAETVRAARRQARDHLLEKAVGAGL